MFWQSGDAADVEHDDISGIFTHFEENSVCAVCAFMDNNPIVLLVGSNQRYAVPADELEPIDVEKTGDAYSHKICNMMSFAKTGRDRDGGIRGNGES